MTFLTDAAKAFNATVTTYTDDEGQGVVLIEWDGKRHVTDSESVSYMMDVIDGHYSGNGMSVIENELVERGAAARYD